MVRFRQQAFFLLIISILFTADFVFSSIIPEEEIENFVRAGNKYLMEDDLDGAITQFDSAITCIQQVKPKKDYALVYYKRGRAHERKKELAQALSDYEDSLKFDPYFLLGYYGSAEIYMKKGSIEHAIERYGTIIEIDPEQPHAYNNLGLAYLQKSDLDKAMPCFSKAIELDPDFVNAHHNRALVRLSQKNYYDALLDLNKETQLLPGSFVARHYYLAVFYFFNKKYDAAWEQVMMLQKTREPINQSFLEELKKASGMSEPKKEE
ncbi:MAG: tetratricopeptide repeat protein [Candidatus Omnitrophica bacterium]|nr:tetratricopeptide repeat protein [Candidatus Omnitrophota bacterium]